MTEAPHPFCRRFWTGAVDARPLAWLRIALGALILADLADRLRDFHAFYTDAGILPRAALPDVSGYFGTSLFLLSGSPRGVAALFLLGALCATAFLAGYRTRLTTVLTWLFVNSLQTRNIHICDSGDSVIRVLLFWGIFADLGACSSLDVWLGRRPRQSTVPALPVRFLQLQIALVYLVSAASKTGGAWVDGTAVARALRGGDFARPLGVWLGGHLRLSHALTRFTELAEWGFAPLILSPLANRRARALALGSGLALHAGIFATMRVGVFSIVMPVSYLALLPGEWVEAALGWLGIATPSPAPSPRAGRWTRRFAVLLPLQFAAILWSQANLLWQIRPPPSAVQSYLGYTGLWQDWRMFSPDPPLEVARWEAPGIRTDGSPVEVLAVAGPEMLPHPGFLYSRWYKLRSNLQGGNPAALQLLGKFLCRRYNGGLGGVRLQRFDLVLDVRPIDLPGDPVRKPQRLVMLHQPCIAPEARGPQTVPKPLAEPVRNPRAPHPETAP